MYLHPHPQHVMRSSVRCGHQIDMTWGVSYYLLPAVRVPRYGTDQSRWTAAPDPGQALSPPEEEKEDDKHWCRLNVWQKGPTERARQIGKGVCTKQIRSLSRWRGSPVKVIFDKSYRLLQGRARQADAECVAAKTARIVLGIACCTAKARGCWQAMRKGLPGTAVDPTDREILYSPVRGAV
ncbi:MAG: hypothetical protein FRX49_09605 [Trebouxia sp. A1-2]|nr:MAG: hypothetical protein FRX49_09605 [Trebouxia sp. A1-2]